jgi:hypothetical protein
MPEELLVRHGSPTLAGLKTGNLFACAFADRRELGGELRRINRRLSAKGVRLLPLRCREGRALLYLYRPDRLSRDLARDTARQLLAERGYPVEAPSRCLTWLMRRLAQRDEFPHEIGLFLGYPPEDVRGFIECGAQDCKCAGCWKVYGDAEAARRTFARFRKCTEVYCSRYAAGTPLERLTVAV